MKKQDVIAFEAFVLSDTDKTISSQLQEKLYEFLAKSYHLTNQTEFMNLIIQPKAIGELVVLYGVKAEIAGFCRLFIQKIPKKDSSIRVYLAQVYLNQLYNYYPSADNMGFTSGIKYKLAHPDEELIYVAVAGNPFTYTLYNQLVKSLYPKPNELIPEKIIRDIHALKQQNDWHEVKSNPLLISSTLVPIRSSGIDFHQGHSELEEFYLSINPDYMQGKSLLIYMPLNLANINYGLNYMGKEN